MGLDGEALVVAILPGPAAIDEKRLQANPGEQLPHCVRRKLGTVVWADLARRLAIGEQNGQIAARHHQMPSVAMILPLDVLVIVRAPFDAYSPSRWVTLWSTAGPSH